MKNTILLIINIFLFNYLNSQDYRRYIPEGYVLEKSYETEFNNDTLKDVLLILFPKEAYNAVLDITQQTKSKTIILLGDKTGKMKFFFESDNIFPCRECAGRSDVFVDNLFFKNNTLTYTTCNFPFPTDYYYVSTYKLRLIDKDFYLDGFDEIFYKNASDDNSIKIHLEKKDLIFQKFDFYTFNNADNDWVDHIQVLSGNVAKLNDIAFYLYKKEQYYLSLKLLQKILQKFPARTVAYLNLADTYWEIGDKENAKGNYKKYVELMKSQNKDLKKIPKYVWERTQ